MMTKDDLMPAQIEAVRRFNRLYTREIGLLRKNFLDTPWTLGEMRILFEIANGDGVTASGVARALDLDTAYVSRLLSTFEKRGLLVRTPKTDDGRQMVLSLTAAGREAFGPANRRQIAEVEGMLTRLPAADRRRLTDAMATIEALLSDLSARNPLRAQDGVSPVELREPRPGEFGWIVTLNAELYGREYGWGGPFEGLCAQIVADFVNDFEPSRERCWIAARGEQRLGCIMLVRDDEPGGDPDTTARIRLLALDAAARGDGIGRRLVEASIVFARQAGYRRVVLWTHSVLTAARAIYAKAGFRMTGTEQHDSWGQPVTSEFWELDL